MATVTAQQITIASLLATYSAASGGGDKFTPGDNIVLHVKNASGASITGTVATPGTVVGQAIGDVPIVVAAGTERFDGPFPREHFANPTDALADITWSATASVTFAVLRV